MKSKSVAIIYAILAAALYCYVYYDSKYGGYGEGYSELKIRDIGENVQDDAVNGIITGTVF